MEQVTIVKANALSEIEDNQVYISYTDKGDCNDKIIRPLSPKIKTFDLDVKFGCIEHSSLKRLLITYPKLLFACYKSLNKLINELYPDIIISTGGVEKYPLAILSLKNKFSSRRRKFLREFHFASIYRRFISSGSKSRVITSITEFIESHIIGNLFDRSYLLTKEDKLSNFANNKKFDYMYNPATFRIPSKQEFNGFKKEKIVVAIGRLSYQKWIAALIKAWSKVANSEISEGWTLKILGDGQERKYLENLVKELSLSDSVEFLGHVSNVTQHLENASIYCTTSRYEGLQLSLIEAMAYGCVPVAFTHTYGPKDVISDNKNGILVEMGNIDAYADALKNLMSNPEKIHELSSNSYLRACDFSQDKIIKAWMEKYQQLLANNQ